MPMRTTKVCWHLTFTGALACFAITLGLIYVTERSPLLAILITGAIASFRAWRKLIVHPAPALARIFELALTNC
jgi:hypothetical protein